MGEAWEHPLRRWRKEQGLTLDAAAAGVGTFRQTWLDWETERRIPNRIYMPKLYVFTRGAITADTMHFPRGYPDFETPRLPFELEPQPAPLLDAVQGAAEGSAVPERQAA
jgi:transcriptional regulator with XRE-family HTH domain